MSDELEQFSDELGTEAEIQAAAGRRKWFGRIVPVVILGVGIAATVAMVKSRKPPKRTHTLSPGLLVETTEARWTKREVRVSANGTISPQREVTIAPEVSGKVVWVNKGLMVGGIVKKGQPLLRISPLDYKLAVDRAQVMVASTERQVAEAESNASVARKEWKHLGAATGNTPTALTLHKPQLKAARAALAGAHAELSQARANLSRTTLRAPFNLRVRQETVDVGQYVRVGQAVATVYGTDAVEVIVALPVAELRWLDLPGESWPPEQAPKVTVRLRTGEMAYEREGLLVRTVGEVDTSGRMSKVVVAINDPFNLEGKKQGGYRPDFEIGAFVDVVMPGRTLAKVMAIPAQALRIGSVVWVADKQQKLRIRPVTVARRDNDQALISAGLQEGERVIVTKINGAVDGMKLRVRASDKPEQVSLGVRAK